ncbi:hypothetical protein [Brachyspira sp. G79]|uniref:hypothetical protein n=1 Tax=Brachyspira sp. G79 TaxID=1358104 RepID=UPI000BBC324E|nr:hypothetical protein [Brachyspira sp. G79]PCG19472.1 hypothetical protein KQ44_05095 [Brachyspira sp. G79]
MSPQKIDSKEVLAIKILAEYSDLKKYIYMVFFIDKYDSKIMDIAFVISNDNKLLKFLNSYTDLLALYKHIKIYNKLNNENNTLFEKFQKIISDIFSDNKNINNIIIYQSSNNTISIIDIFASSMNKFMDFHIGTFDVAHKVLSFEDVSNALDNVNKELENTAVMHASYSSDSNSSVENTDTSKQPEAPSYKLINASFIVDPIGGTSINDINVGDKVMVSINSNTVEENIIYLELKGKKDKYSKYIVPAEVLEKHVEEKSIKILLKLIDGFCALIEELEPIKLKVFNPTRDVYVEGEDNDADKKPSLISRLFSKINTFKLVMFGMAAVILILFIAIIYVFFFQV